jgi:hypothetical protein
MREMGESGLVTNGVAACHLTMKRRPYVQIQRVTQRVTQRV